MIYYTKGNLFESNADVLVNPVNCVGAMGAGIAQQFAKRFPELEDAYKQRCLSNKIHPGDVWCFQTEDLDILNVATKNHWRDESKLEWVDKGLMQIADILEVGNYASVAIPALGCGLGRLKWEDVKYLIKEHLGELTGINIFVFEPNSYKFSRRKRPFRPNPTRGDRDDEPEAVDGVAIK